VWVVLSKGIENESLKVPTQVLAEILDPAIKTAVLGGPSFAQEVMERKLTGVMLASVDQERAQFITSLLANHYFYPWVSDDELGVQLGGALKNVGALLMGIAQGAGFSDNTRAWLFTRCWHELTFIACSLGAQEKTLAGLAGIGDLFLTVLGSYSRNLALGRSIGQGHGVRYAASDVCVLPEGINTIRSVRQLIDQRGLTLVLCQALYAIIFEKARNELLLQAVVSSENYSN
jgi:glycerol-3-phosphate dehydrogenase (NAD(P)+)